MAKKEKILVPYSTDLSALKTINQIMKKVTGDTDYIIVNGVCIGYDTNIAIDDFCANGITISFIGDKLLNKLGIFSQYPIYIVGKDIYQAITNKEYTFTGITVGEDGIYVDFETYVLDTTGLKRLYLEKAVEKKYDLTLAEEEYQMEFKNNINLYELYLKVKSQYVPEKIATKSSVLCKFITNDNYLIHKTNKVIHKLLQGTLIAEKTLGEELIEKIIEAEKPIELSIPTIRDDVYTIRLMKSLIKTAPSSVKEVIIRAVEEKQFVYMILQYSADDMTVCTIFKTINI